MPTLLREREESELMLCEAAINGDVDSLMEILQKDRLILDRAANGVSTVYPLHIAASYGHELFVKRLLEMNEMLADVLDHVQHRTALHLASARGHVSVVKVLIDKRPEMCLTSDKQGRNPLHVAAMEGMTDVLRILFEKRPHVVNDRVNGGDTILHLCVKYDQMESLEVLLKLVEGSSEFVNAQDGSGNTVLHLAVSRRNSRLIEHLLDRDQGLEINENVRNAKDQTAMDILHLAKKSGKEESETIKHIMFQYIEYYLLLVGAETGEEILQRDWLSSKKDVVMIVASLMATIAFQVGVSPPGGVRQDDKPGPNGHRAGQAVMAYHNPDTYRNFVWVNSVGLVATMCAITLLLSGLAFKRRFYMWGLVVTIWISLSSMAFTYTASVTVVTPKKYRHLFRGVKFLGYLFWLTMMASFLLIHTYKWIRSWWRDHYRKHMKTRTTL